MLRLVDAAGEREHDVGEHHVVGQTGLDERRRERVVGMLAQVRHEIVEQRLDLAPRLVDLSPHLGVVSEISDARHERRRPMPSDVDFDAPDTEQVHEVLRGERRGDERVEIGVVWPGVRQAIEVEPRVGLERLRPALLITFGRITVLTGPRWPRCSLPSVSIIEDRPSDRRMVTDEDRAVNISGLGSTALQPL